MALKPSITYRSVIFEELIVEYKDLKIFRPHLFCASYWFLLKIFQLPVLFFTAAPPRDWYYLGPVAVSPESLPGPEVQVTHILPFELEPLTTAFNREGSSDRKSVV